MPTLANIAELLGIPCSSHGDRIITGAHSLSEAGPNDLSVLGGDPYVKQYKLTKAGAVLVSRKVRFIPRADVPTLIVDDADIAMVTFMNSIAPPVQQPDVGIHPSATVAPNTWIGDGAAIGPHAVVGQRTRIGKNVKIHSGVSIGDDCIIGDNCVFYPNVVIRERITIGNRVIINASSTIGTDGFGYKWNGREHLKIPQVGTVIIDDDVEIGSGTCVDRAKFSNTRIGRGTKIDNLVQIAHNVQIGMFCIICGQVAIAGSAKIGNGVVLGGSAGIRDHVKIADGAIIGAGSGVMDDIGPKSVVSGVPASNHRQKLREQSAARRLPELIVEIRKLQDQVKRLSESKTSI